MKRYRVHLYAVVRVPMEWVEAESQTDAIQKVLDDDSIDLYERLTRDGAEYADDISGFLVDEEGDDEYKQSRFYKADGKTVDAGC